MSGGRPQKTVEKIKKYKGAFLAAPGNIETVIYRN